MATVNAALADAVVGLRLDLLRFEAGTVQALVRAYTGALADTSAALDRALEEAGAGRPLSPRTVELLSARAAALRGDLVILLGRLQGDLREALDAAALSEAAQLMITFQEVVPASAGIDWVRPAPVDVAAAVLSPGRAYTESLALDLLVVYDSVHPVIARGAASGASVPALVKDLKRALGAIAGGRSRLVTIARTEIQRTANAAALATYRANADVVQGVEYLATLDSRTCPVCAPSHGQTWDLEDPAAPAIPRHPRCRCFYAPVLKSWTDLRLGPSQRSLFDGAPSGGDDFQDWLKRQPEAVQREMLGAARFEAWTAGADLADFTDGRRILTLDDLRARGVIPPDTE